MMKLYMINDHSYTNNQRRYIGQEQAVALGMLLL